MAYNTGTYVLFDAASAGALTTADNGLTINPAGNVQWGGTLIQNTLINTDTFDWSFAADNAGTPRTALGFDYSLSAFYFGSPAGNYAVTGEWYLSPTGQAGYLRFNTFDASDTAIEIGVDAANNSQVRLYDGAATLGIDIGKTAANNWGVTLGNAVNQEGRLTIHRWNNLSPGGLQVFQSGTEVARMGDNGSFITANVLGTIGNNAGFYAYSGTFPTVSSLFALVGRNGLGVYNDTTDIGGLSNGIWIRSKDLTAGNTIPVLQTEGTGIITAGAATNSHTAAIEINGTTYYILLASTR